MAEVNCTKEEFASKDGRCCDRCPAGWHMKAECDGTKVTECAECKHRFYMGKKNNLNACRLCTVCSSKNKQRTVKECTTRENTVCECLDGFYCNNDQCDHCQPVSHCPQGEGVKVPVTRRNDTICAPCEDGTYSNVTDFFSPCQTHTRCEDIGRVLKTPGTRTANAICGDFKSHCHWMLPAGLWSGLVLTALVLFGLLYWREKRKSYRTASSRVPVTLIEMAPAAPDSPPAMPLRFTEFTEQNGYCQESCTMNGCDSPLLRTDDNGVSADTQDEVDSCTPITLSKASVSFTEPSHMNGSSGYSTSNFLRTYSEPQEDEWCGT